MHIFSKYKNVNIVSESLWTIPIYEKSMEQILHRVVLYLNIYTETQKNTFRKGPKVWHLILPIFGLLSS